MIELEYALKHELRRITVPYTQSKVWRGLWWFFSTYGVPIGEQFSQLFDLVGEFPDWAYLCVELAGNGWNDKRIYEYITAEMWGCYSREVGDNIRAGLAGMLNQKET